jgi:predicted ester cyclase
LVVTLGHNSGHCIFGRETLLTPDHSDTGSRILANFRQGQFERILAPDVVIQDRAQETSVRGQAAAARFLRAFFSGGFPGAKMETTVEQVEEDCLVLALRLDGLQNGRLMGIPPTGRAVQLDMTLTCRLRQGQIYRIELDYDAAALLRQLGLAL